MEGSIFAGKKGKLLLALIILLVAVVVAFVAVFFAGGNSDNDYGTVDYSYTEPTYNNLTSDQTTQDKNRDDVYLAAVESLKNEVKADIFDDTLPVGLAVDYCMIDVNSDGYDDIIYHCEYKAFIPVLEVYDNGKFVKVEIDSEVVGGSLFPSGENSGYFIDKDKGIIVIRYGGHTEGTNLYHGAQAFKINENTAESQWVLYSDADKYAEYEEKVLAYQECMKDFENKYQEKTQGCNFVDFFDLAEIWIEGRTD